MKRLFLVLCVLLFSVRADAWEVIGSGGGASTCNAGTNTGDLFSETFSGANSLSCGGTVALTGWTCTEEVGNTIDPDYDASTLGCGFDSQSLHVIRSSGSANNEAHINKALSSPGEIWGRFYFYLVSESITASTQGSLVYHSQHGVYIGADSSGNPRFVMRAQGTDRAFYSISPEVKYRVEYNIDDTNNLWGWKIYAYSGDTPTEVANSTENSYAITTAMTDWQLGAFANEVVDYVINNADISTSGWIGE